MVRFSAGLAVLFSLSLPARAEDPQIEAVDTVAEAAVGNETPGLAVLVMKEGEVLHMAGYGEADIETGAEVTPDTIFDLASVSKQMTALTAMLQIEDELYDVDTEIATLLPEFENQPGDHRAITVGDLVHHLSGLTDYINSDETLGYGAKTKNPEVVTWLAAQKVDHVPGKYFDYSNSGYLTLGSLVAAADEADSLAEVEKARIWDELGMTRTGIVKLAPGVERDEMATGYKGTGGNFEISSEPTVTEGDGNVLTCLRDLALYEAALANNTLLDEAATERLFENGTFDNGKPVKDENGDGYAFGWTIETEDGDLYADHSGSWMGTATYYQRNLTTGLTVIVLANGEEAGVANLAAEIERVVEAEEAAE